MRQEDLFKTTAYARTEDPATSHIAAADTRLSEIEQVVYEIILSGPNTGMTKDEVHAAQTTTHHERDSISPRFKPLMKKGKIVPMGTRVAKSGKRQMVWLDIIRASKA